MCGFSVFVDFLSGFLVLLPNLVRFSGFGNPPLLRLHFFRAAETRHLIVPSVHCFLLLIYYTSLIIQRARRVMNNLLNKSPRRARASQIKLFFSKKFLDTLQDFLDSYDFFFRFSKFKDIYF